MLRRSERKSPRNAKIMRGQGMLPEHPCSVNSRRCADTKSKSCRGMLAREEAKRSTDDATTATSSAETLFRAVSQKNRCKPLLWPRPVKTHRALCATLHRETCGRLRPAPLGCCQPTARAQSRCPSWCDDIGRKYSWKRTLSHCQTPPWRWRELQVARGENASWQT
jgi:hypothetical protein